MFKNHFRTSTVFTVLLLLCSAWAKANNTALTSGAWETGSNWSTGAAPVSTDNVIVPAGITMTVMATGDVCGSLNIASSGSVIINANENLSIGGSFTNAGSFTASAGSTLIFNGAANSIISGGGTYSIPGTVQLDMGAPAIYLDVQDANFIAGINSGHNYYFTFTQGTFRMDNAGSLANCNNSGSTNSLKIPYGVTIEADAGTMNLCYNGPTGSVILSGKIFMNGGTIDVQQGQSHNSGQDFQYTVNGGTPQLYISSGTLNVGAGFNALTGNDYIDFHMTGGTLVLATNGYSNWITFQLQDVVGGKTFMSAGLIILQDACNAAIEDLDMGGANVASTLYSVTGGTVQVGYYNTQSSSTYFGINAEPATNYPNIDFESGVSKNVSAWTNGTINMLSLHVNTNMTFDATGFPIVDITASNGTFALDDEGGFIPGNNTIVFSGAVQQLISSTALSNETFYNLQISNTSGHVVLGLATTVTNQLNFTSGLLDASKYPATISSGASVTGASATSYVIVGNGVTTTGYLNISNLPTSTTTLFAIGTSTYYLPASINPGSNAGNSYAAFVFTGATTNAVENGPAFSAAIKATMFNAVWNIGQTAGSGTASLTLGWTTAGNVLEGSGFAGAGTNIGIAQYVSGWQGATGSGSVPLETATSSFGSFTQFAVVEDEFVLPVLVSSFTASLNNNHSVLLSWSISGDAQVADFEVQRSTDGTNWTNIGTVQAAAYLATGNNYSLIDPNPAIGVNDYRLQIQNTDGSTTYSAIRAITLGASAGVTIYPVPATTSINVAITGTDAAVAVRIISVTGQILQALAATGTGSSVMTIDISRYPAGTYFVQVIGDNTILQTTPVTKL